MRELASAAASSHSGAAGSVSDSLRAPATDVAACAEGYERSEYVRVSRPSRCGRLRRTTSFVSWFAPYAIATVRAASRRRATAAIMNQTSPCSPSDEKRATSAVVSEPDAVIFGFDPQVDH